MIVKNINVKLILQTGQYIMNFVHCLGMGVIHEQLKNLSKLK